MSRSSRFAVAVHMLTLMAYARDEPVKSEQAACSVNTNPVVIRRILCALSKARLVSSQTGAAGGTKLAREASQITLLDVYRAVEGGRIFLLHRQPPDPECPIGTNVQMVLEGVLGDVEATVDGVLAKITIEKILQEVKRCSGRSTG